MGLTHLRCVLRLKTPVTAFGDRSKWRGSSPPQFIGDTPYQNYSAVTCNNFKSMRNIEMGRGDLPRGSQYLSRSLRGILLRYQIESRPFMWFVPSASIQNRSCVIRCFSWHVFTRPVGAGVLTHITHLVSIWSPPLFPHTCGGLSLPHLPFPSLRLISF